MFKLLLTNFFVIVTDLFSADLFHTPRRVEDFFYSVCMGVAHLDL
jgi:hypothetical protein